MFRRSRILPTIPIFDITWTIPEDFGGLTSMVLRRSSAFSEVDRRRIDILTLSPALDLPAKTRELKETGWLAKRVKLRNLWHELRQAKDRELYKLAGNVDEPVAGDEELLPQSGQEDSERRSKSDQLLQVNRYRVDGSLLVSDRRDTTKKGKLGGRRITLFDRAGEIVTQWTSARSLYHSWIDYVTDGKDAAVICDSARVGTLLDNYRRDNVHVTQVIHTNHREDPETPLDGGLADRFKILTVLDSFDSVAILTGSQRNDLLDNHLGTGNLHALPNIFAGHNFTGHAIATRGNGVIVARLMPVKRLEQSIQTIGTLRDSGATLDIYGDGPEKDNLQAFIDDTHLEDSVKLNGYAPAAYKKFEGASFTLLTSFSEGMPIVLLEAMTAGCIPIAYDLKYGPSDIITHGKDGFLVPLGDIEELSATLRRFLAMPEADVAAMRSAAREKVEQFSSQTVTRRWAEALEAGREAKAAVKRVEGRSGLRAATFTNDNLHLSFIVSGEAAAEPEWMMLAVIGRSMPIYFRVPCTYTLIDEELCAEAVIPSELFSSPTADTVDVFVDVRVDGNRRRMRLSAGEVELPEAFERTTPYSTDQGNLSFRIAGPDTVADESIQREIAG